MKSNVGFRSMCPECGSVRVDPRAVTLLLDADTGESAYVFTCPACSAAAWSVATPATSEMLQGLGAEVVLSSGAKDDATNAGPTAADGPTADGHRPGCR